MRKLLFLLIVVALAGAVPMAAQEFSKADRNMLVQHLKKTQKGLHSATKGLSEAQWSFKPGPDRWSVAECYEHIAASEDFLLDLIANKVMKTPAQPEKKDAAKQKEVDAAVTKMIPDRTNKAQAPEPLKPTNRYGSAKGSQQHFAASRKKTIDFVKTSKEDLRSHFMDSPVIKGMDAAEWILFLSAHSERHTVQIAEVKADPNFPK